MKTISHFLLCFAQRAIRAVELLVTRESVKIHPNLLFVYIHRESGPKITERILIQNEVVHITVISVSNFKFLIDVTEHQVPFHGSTL